MSTKFSNQGQSRKRRDKGPLLDKDSLKEIKILIIILMLCFNYLLWDLAGGKERHWQGPRAAAPTLVLYVFSDTDPEYMNNLAYFAREAIKVRQCLTKVSFAV